MDEERKEMQDSVRQGGSRAGRTEISKEET